MYFVAVLVACNSLLSRYICRCANGFLWLCEIPQMPFPACAHYPLTPLPSPSPVHARIHIHSHACIHTLMSTWQCLTGLYLGACYTSCSFLDGTVKSHQRVCVCVCVSVCSWELWEGDIRAKTSRPNIGLDINLEPCKDEPRHIACWMATQYSSVRVGPGELCFTFSRGKSTIDLTSTDYNYRL